MTKVVGGSTASWDQFSSPGCQEEGDLAANGFAIARRRKMPPKPTGQWAKCTALPWRLRQGLPQPLGSLCFTVGFMHRAGFILKHQLIFKAMPTLTLISAPLLTLLKGLCPWVLLSVRVSPRIIPLCRVNTVTWGASEVLKKDGNSKDCSGHGRNWGSVASRKG